MNKSTKKITKSLFFSYLHCPKNSWLKIHKPELSDRFIPSLAEKARMAQGNNFELLAQKKFQQAKNLQFIDTDQAIQSTRESVQQKTAVLFQPTFVSGNFLARCDVLEYDAEVDAWNLYEIKAKSSISTEDYNDLAFQIIVLRQQGISVAKAFIMHLNKEYTFAGGDIDINAIVTEKDVTTDVQKQEEEIRLGMQKAEQVLLSVSEDELVCRCLYVGRSAQCQTFSYSHPQIPEYSVHDINSIGKNKKDLATLIDSNIIDIADVPDTIELNTKQMNQIYAHKTQLAIIDHNGITQELNRLEYPLYFLDYESYLSAIPLFKGYKPYQQMIFQFSVHVVHDKDSEPIHHEYLHQDAQDPSLGVIHGLLKAIGSKGSVLVWYKSFEKTRNEELAALHPEYKEFIKDINNRMYDLMDIFNKQLYVDPKFRGSSSIKKVLPVLVPQLSYQDLSVQKGDQAPLIWYDMIYKNISKEEQLEMAHGLKQYCGLDTYAMYKIWEFLTKLDINNRK